MVKKLNPRYLAERSYLYFKYPQPADGFDRTIEFYLPMLENIEVSESQKPNLATYDLIGRAGSLFSYLGSKSREFNLKFNITLPNVLEYIQNTLGTTGGLASQFQNGFRYFYNERDIVKRLMTQFNNGKFLPNEQFSPYEKSKQYNPNQPEFDPSYDKDNVNKDGMTAFFEGFTGVIKDISTFFVGEQNPKSVKEAVDYVIRWINVIRSSTINNSKDTNLGPPTVYLNHGTMYNNIPCVCTNYSIKIVNSLGYDLLSMTPRQIEVTLSLSENRVGNFGNYEPFTLITSENRAGWESIHNYNTMDPYNSTFDEFQTETRFVNMVSDSLESGTKLPPLPNQRITKL